MHCNSILICLKSSSLHHIERLCILKLISTFDRTPEKHEGGKKRKKTQNKPNLGFMRKTLII